MNIQQFRYFVSVAKNLNFTAASKELFVSQTSVSKQIASLETKLGVKLFVRDRRNVQLTTAGNVLFEEATKVLNSFDQAVEKTINAKTGSIGQVKIGFLGPVEEKYLPSLLQAFQTKNPNIKVTLNQFYLGPLMDALQNEKLDLVFTLSTVVQNDFSVAFEKLYEDTFVVVCNEKEWFASYEQIELSELRNEQFILLNKEKSVQAYDLVIDSCLSNSFEPEIIAEPDSYEHIIMLVKAGMGISIIPRCIKGYYGANGVRFIPIVNEPIKYNVVIAWNKGNENPYIQLFKEELIQRLDLYE